MITIIVKLKEKPVMSDGRCIYHETADYVHIVDTIEDAEKFAIRMLENIPYSVNDVGLYRYYHCLDYSNENNLLVQISFQIHEGNPLYG
jgi:hypothetical protein